MKCITAIRVMLAVTVILLLTAAIPIDWRSAKGIDVALARARIHEFGRALARYKTDVGTFPTIQEGLEALCTRPLNVNQWDGPYLREIPLDPWGHPYVYKFPGDQGIEPDIICYGADGKAGGKGKNADIVSREK